MPRERIVERLRRELMGYGSQGQNERIPERPSLRYLIGQLYPVAADPAAAEEHLPPEGEGSTPDNGDVESPADGRLADEDDDLDDGDSLQAGEEQEEDQATPTSSFLPQSIGLTCNVWPEARWLDAEVEFGTYAEVRVPQNGGAGPARVEWERSHRTHHHRIPLPAADGTVRDEVQFNGQDSDHPVATIEWIIRRNTDAAGEVTVILSIFLINSTSWPPDGNDPNHARIPEDQYCIFQPVLRLRDRDGGLPFLDRKPESRWSSTDPDLERFKLLFRCYPEFAIGHGCAAHWRDVSGDSRAGCVFTDLIPDHELPRVIYDPAELDSGTSQFLEMRRLVEMDVHVLRQELLRLPAAYQQWIASRSADVGSSAFPSALAAKAWEHLDNCREACRRMEDGITLLCLDTPDNDALRAFRFMNEVMELQQRHVALVRLRREAETSAALGHPIPSVCLPPSGPEFRWRPFQLAFILMNLRGIIEPTHAERQLVDLLWFPTGGGKTEAYLGLTAFTLALRRIRAARQPDPQAPRGDGGVTVIMRYTLRLLTSQQFQRAAALICACELQRANNALGTEPFLIGMWVGSALTPNSIAECDEVLKGGRSLNGGDPRQLKRCPWCGTRLGSSEYLADTDLSKLSIRCANAACEFSQQDFPILLIDEEIYARCPSLIIGTVDKFARLPWQKKTASLFGIVDRHCPRHGYQVPGITNHPNRHQGKARPAPFANLPQSQVVPVSRFLPPDLIIQDELHLISGPLGTMVGLYEAAVDFLCAADNLGASPACSGPKIVASTATIRRGREQVLSLFAREVREFPPPGISATDSFFARLVGPDASNRGRKYVGICAPGQSLATTQLRMSGVLLQQPWDDLVAAGVARSVLDPYLTFITFFNSLREVGAAQRRFQDDIPKFMGNLCGRHPGAGFVRRVLREINELTSRRKASEIPEILERLDLPSEAPDGLDTVLVTNMFSVGVDVNRLALMAVIGQPKSTSEYIQATSRVGRQHPGLVVMMYNFARPRDLSHYERFHAYHQSLQRYVEPTGVTPFSPRARDRALHAVYVAIARLLGTSGTTSWADSPNASLFDQTLAGSLTPYILGRVAAIDPTQAAAVRREMDDIEQWWADLVAMVNGPNPVGTWAPSASRGAPRPPSLRYEYHPRCSSPIAWLLRHAGQRLLSIQPPPQPPNYNPDERAKATLDSLRDVEQNTTLYRLQ